MPLPTDPIITTTQTLPDGSVQTTSRRDGQIIEVKTTGIPGQAYTATDVAYREDTGQVSAITRSGYMGLPYVSATSVYGDDGKVAVIIFEDDSGTYAVLTYAADGSFGVEHLEVTGQDYTAYTNLYTAGGTLTGITYTGYNGLPYTAKTVDLATDEVTFTRADGSVYSVLSHTPNGGFSNLHPNIRGQAYTSLTTVYTADNVLIADSLTGIQNASYDTEEQGFSTDGLRFEDVYVRHGLVTEVKTVAADGTVQDRSYQVPIGQAVSNTGQFVKAATNDQWSILPNINNTGSIDVERGSLLIIGDVDNTGTLQVGQGAVFDLDGALSGNGAVDIGGGGSQFTLGDGGAGTFTFTGGGAILDLDTPAEFMGRIAGFGAQSQIDLPGFSGQSALAYTPNQGGTGGTLAVIDGNAHLNLSFVGHYQTSDFTVAANSAGTALLRHT